MASALKLFFWLCSLLTAYVYFLYPLLIMRVSRSAGRKYVKSDILPSLSVIITAYNEERNIAGKIENTLELDYPGHLMEVIVGSDGSTDRTDEIVRSYEDRGVRLLSFPENRGKTMVQNDCVREARGEIIVFMDAASLCSRDSLRKLAANFADPRVGAVAGRVAFTRAEENLTTESQGVYWKYEQFLKKAESSLGSLVGVDGPLYAIRKDLCEKLDEDMMSDFISPLLVIKNGHSVVYEPEAVTYEEATVRAEDEIRTRRRIVNRGLAGLSKHRELVNPAASPLLAWQIISHKVLRWLVGFYYLGMLATSLVLAARWFFFFAFSGLMAILCLSHYSLWMQDRQSRWFTIPYYFVLVNMAAVLGSIDFIKGKRVISWKPVRE
ncbi:MAG TPA: glycosyltransferase family 2 protein [Deltaproteobacteria bacterium]|jgi:cellulose synthase/poly-beta-1,6-N-acetylglucosamine synthase-like glycosyltransferase|nr:glycosyltransferase family 2 protein [Deltaproteobacteria bacterium]HQI02249.1 glycosyltransferase family 2 protein [Deltaproteobacteria bacterium]